MRNPEDEVQDIARLATENWEDNYVKEVYCDVTMALYVDDIAPPFLCRDMYKT